MVGLVDAPSHKPVPRTLSHGTVHPPGRQDEPQSGDALSPPLQRQLRGSTSTVPDPLTSQGFCWVPEHLAEPMPASRLASTDCRRYSSTRGPGPTHTWGPCWGALSTPRPSAPSGPGTTTPAYTRPCHTHSPSTGQEESEWLGDTDLAPRGASSRYSGGSVAPSWTGSTWPHKVSAS